jgi:hypothetical protein
VSDDIDRAQEHEQQLRDDALRTRKPVPLKCECGLPVAVLHNGVNCKYCKACLAANMVGHLDTI